MFFELNCKENYIKAATYFQWVLRMQFLFSNIYLLSVLLSNRSYAIVQGAYGLFFYHLKLH